MIFLIFVLVLDRPGTLLLSLTIKATHLPKFTYLIMMITFVIVNPPLYSLYSSYSPYCLICESWRPLILVS